MKVPDCAAAVIAGRDVGKYKQVKISQNAMFYKMPICPPQTNQHFVIRVLIELFLLRYYQREEVFLLANSINNLNKVNAGTCPHGCSPSACPICSGMGGGGLRPGERVQKPGELSYHQCAMLGALMRAREARIKTHEQNLQNRAEAFKKFEAGLEFAAARLADFALKISRSILLKPVAIIINKILIPVLNTIKSLPRSISNIFSMLNRIKTDIQDKLNAIFGEAKAFIEKKVSEFVAVIKSKLDGLFKIFKRNNTKDEETKIDEDKKIFRLKTFINKLLRRNNDTEDSAKS